MAFTLPASAQDKTLSKKEIEALNKRAKTMVATQNVVAAIAIFEEIFASTNDPKYLYNIGYLYQDSGQLDVAWDYYQRFLMEWPDAPNAEDLQTYLGELAQTLKKSHVLTHLFTDPAGASVTILADDITRKPSGVTPLSVWLPRGPVTLTFKRDGFQPLKKNWMVGDKRAPRLRLALTPEPAGASLTLGAIPEGTTVLLDGEALEQAATGQVLTLKPGSHTLTLRLANGDERSASLIVTGETLSGLDPGFWSSETSTPTALEAVSGDPTTLSTSAETSTWKTPIGSWVLGGVSLAAAIGGSIVMALGTDAASQARNAADAMYAESNSIDTNNSLYLDWQSQSDQADMMSVTSYALYGVAGAAAIASLAWALSDNLAEGPRAARNDIKVLPSLSPAGGGAHVTWSF